MEIIQNMFRPRLPPRLTLTQIGRISNQTNLSPAEVEKWYGRFILCFPSGYVSYDEFLIYLKQLSSYTSNQPFQLSKLIVKQLFCTLDVNKDKQLNFEEFFRFNLLINQESKQEKLEFILNLYDREKQICYSHLDIFNILTNMFDLLNIPHSKNDLFERIDTVLTLINMNDRNAQISWNTFCTSVLNQPILLDLLLCDRFDETDTLKDMLVA